MSLYFLSTSGMSGRVLRCTEHPGYQPFTIIEVNGEIGAWCDGGQHNDLAPGYLKLARRGSGGLHWPTRHEANLAAAAVLGVHPCEDGHTPSPLPWDRDACQVCGADITDERYDEPDEDAHGDAEYDARKVHPELQS